MVDAYIGECFLIYLVYLLLDREQFLLNGLGILIFE